MRGSTAAGTAEIMQAGKIFFSNFWAAAFQLSEVIVQQLLMRLSIRCIKYSKRNELNLCGSMRNVLQKLGRS